MCLGDLKYDAVDDAEDDAQFGDTANQNPSPHIVPAFILSTINSFTELRMLTDTDRTERDPGKL